MRDRAKRDDDVATRGRRWRKRRRRRNVYRTRHCVRVGVDGGTASKPSRKTCVSRLFSARHPRLICVCRATNVQTRGDAIRHCATLCIIIDKGKTSLSIPISGRPVITKGPLMCPPSHLSNSLTYDLLLLQYFVGSCDSLYSG